MRLGSEAGVWSGILGPFGVPRVETARHEECGGLQPKLEGVLLFEQQFLFGIGRAPACATRRRGDRLTGRMGYRSTIEGTFSWTDHPLPLGIKVAQRYRTKMDFVAYQRLADRDGFADEGFAEEDEFPRHLISPLERTRRMAASAA